jgi:hypothetical protein
LTTRNHRGTVGREMAAPAGARASHPPPGDCDGAPPTAVVPVTGWTTRRDFLRVPGVVHAGDPQWIPPLQLERRIHLSRRNPFFRHAEACLFVAYENGVPVGRISAQIDRLHLERYRDATGFFGFLDAIDEPRVFAALSSAAETWLAARGMERVRGPFSFSINDEIGVLIDGFDTPPMFMMPHGAPYYDTRIRAQGYEKAKDVVAYLLEIGAEMPPFMQAVLRRDRGGRIRTRPIDLGRLREEVAIIGDIFNDAWENNWGYVRWTAEELDDLGSSLKLFVPPELVQIAEIDGEPAAMIVVVPNLNEAIRDLDGRLLPLGWLKLLRRVRWGSPTSARVPLMGMRKQHQRSATGMALVIRLLEAVRTPLLRRGMRRIELSWTLEDNRPMRHIKERLGASVYKTYRIYEKALSGRSPR